MAECAAEIGMSVAWVRKQVTARAIPFHEFGRSVRFFDDDMAEIKAARRVVPRPAVTPVRPITSARRRAAA